MNSPLRSLSPRATSDISDSVGRESEGKSMGAMARLLSRIEAEDSKALEAAFKSEQAHGLDALIVGITGYPGVGKSTLIGATIKKLRSCGLSVAVLAIDPSSSRTGGAMLGDRIRMLAAHGDPQVFIRSMASRGRLGGLSATAPAAVSALAGAGYNVVLVETVGVGQSEIDVARLADATVVVLAPGMGDSVQALKAGLLEEADVFVVNKEDRGGAGETVSQISSMLDAGEALHGHGPRPPILRTVAVTGQGVDELVEKIRANRGCEQQRKRLRDERIKWALRDAALAQLMGALSIQAGSAENLLEESVARVRGGEISLQQAAAELLRAAAS